MAKLVLNASNFPPKSRKYNPTLSKAVQTLKRCNCPTVCAGFITTPSKTAPRLKASLSPNICMQSDRMCSGGAAVSNSSHSENIGKKKIEKGGINETTFDISDIDSDTPIYPKTLYTASDRLAELQQTSPWNLFGEVKASSGYYVEVAGQMINDLNRSYLNLWNTKFGSSGRIYFDPATTTLTLDNLKWDYSNHSIIDNFGNPKNLTIKVKGECILGVNTDDVVFFLAGDNTVTTITNANKNSSLTLRLGAKSTGINASRSTQCILKDANLIIESYPDVDSFESGIDGKPGWGTGGMGNLSIINSVVQITKSPASGAAIGGFLSMNLDGCEIITPQNATIGDDYTICENGEAAKKVLIAPTGHPVGIASTKNGAKSKCESIYTPDGVRLTTPFGLLPRGIYIVNGKKVVKK